MLVAATLVALLVGVGIGFALHDSSKKANVAVSSPTPVPASGPARRNPTRVQPSRPRQAPTPVSFTVGEKAPFGNGASIQVFSYQPNVAPAQSFTTTTAGMSYAVIDVELCAGRVAAPYNDRGFKAKMADKSQYGATTPVKQPDLSAGVLRVGSGCTRGYVTLQIPQGQKPVAIVWRYGNWRPTSWSVQ